jgi:hypothetical protein
VQDGAAREVAAQPVRNSRTPVVAIWYSSDTCGAGMTCCTLHLRGTVILLWHACLRCSHRMQIDLRCSQVDAWCMQVDRPACMLPVLATGDGIMHAHSPVDGAAATQLALVAGPVAHLPVLPRHPLLVPLLKMMYPCSVVLTSLRSRAGLACLACAAHEPGQAIQCSTVATATVLCGKLAWRMLMSC